MTNTDADLIARARNFVGHVEGESLDYGDRLLLTLADALARHSASLPHDEPAPLLGPHPRWKATDKSDRHPQSVDEWDYRTDPVGGALDCSLRRLNVACDYDDPRAPDQMALVLRVDLSRVLADRTHKHAAWEIWCKERERSAPLPADVAETAKRMQQTFDVTGDKWFDRAASLIAEQAREIERLTEERNDLVKDGLAAEARIKVINDQNAIWYEGKRQELERSEALVQSKSNQIVELQTEAVQYRTDLETAEARVREMQTVAFQAQEMAKEIEVATIERCAKVAEDSPISYYGVETRPMIAAAIRVLKEPADAKG